MTGPHVFQSFMDFIVYLTFRTSVSLQVVLMYFLVLIFAFCTSCVTPKHTENAPRHRSPEVKLGGREVAQQLSRHPESAVRNLAKLFLVNGEGAQLTIAEEKTKSD